MPFDINNGLSSLGDAVSKTAGAYMLEAQKGELMKESMVLADQMASKRESAGRQEQGLINAAAADKAQTHQSGENALNRTSHEKISEAQRQATIAAAGISAGASMANAKLSAEVQREALTPTEVRTAQWFEKATPEERAAFQDVLLAKHAEKPPQGYRSIQGGGLEAIPGGPADPARQRADKVPAGYRLASDGVTLEFIPGGPADPAIARRAGPMNNEQARDAGFSDRMTHSQSVLSKLDTQGTNAWMRIAEGAGKAGNYAQSEDYQKFRQAKEDFVNAQLRRESGAAISADEFKKADQQYFPQPGDKPEMIEQKAKNRQLALEAMIRGAGPTYKPSPSVTAPKGDEPSGAALPPVAKRAIGKVYDTPTGSYIWMGDGWAKPPQQQGE